MKNQKRIMVTLVACLLWMVTILSRASAENIFLPQAALMINTAYVDAIPMGSGRIDTVAFIECDYAVDSLGFSYIRLQELRDGTWTTVKSVSSKYIGNAVRYTYTFTYYGTPGMDYRAKAGFVASDGLYSETRSDTSATRTCY